MDAKELRIGNRVQLTTEWFNKHPELSKTVKIITVDSISKEHLLDDFYYVSEYFLSDLEGIPLTEEWLVKFGFETMDAEMDLMEYAIDKNGTFIFSILNDGGLNNHNTEPFYYLTEGQLNGWAHQHRVEIKYVHSLQNLIFALTGDELTTK